VENFTVFLIAAFVHEAGHFLTARILGIPVLAFRPTGSGAVMTFDFSGTTYLREAMVHLAGALFGMLTAVLARWILGARANFCLGITAVLSLVNLLPIAGMDGGGVLRCVLSCLFQLERTEKICRIVSLSALLLLWTAVLWAEMRTAANFSLLFFVIGLMLANCS